MKRNLERQASLNALYDLEYGGGLNQLTLIPHSPASCYICSGENGPCEEVSLDFIEKFTKFDLEQGKDHAVNKLLRDVNEAKKEIIKVFEKLRMMVR